MQTPPITLFALLLTTCALLASACNDAPDNSDPEDKTPKVYNRLWETEEGECGNGIIEGWEECDDGDDMPNNNCFDCRIQIPRDGEPLALPNTNDWEYYEIEGARCRDGSPSGFSVSPGANTSELLFYFEGGGACFEAMNCTANPPAIGQGKFPAPAGIFDRTHPDNPFQDWTFIYLPYCSGDVFAGNATGVDIPNGPSDQKFVGDTNMTLYLERILPTFAGAEHIVSTGISAGGLASIVNAKRLARAFSDAPRITVLDDGGPPLSTKVVSGCMQEHWNDLYHLRDTVLPDCGWNCTEPGDLLLPMAQDLVTSNDRIDVGLFSFLHDSTVRLLFTFGLKDCRWLPAPFMKESVFEEGLQEFRTIMRETGEQSPDQTALRTATFYAPGTKHVCIRDDCFYDTEVDGVRLTDWTHDLLSRSFSDVGFTD